MHTLALCFCAALTYLLQAMSQLAHRIMQIHRLQDTGCRLLMQRCSMFPQAQEAPYPLLPPAPPPPPNTLETPPPLAPLPFHTHSCPPQLTFPTCCGACRWCRVTPQGLPEKYAAQVRQTAAHSDWPADNKTVKKLVIASSEVSLAVI